MLFGRIAIETEAALLERTQSFLQTFGEGTTNSHHFTDALHLRSENSTGAGQFFKRPAWDLGDDIVNRWLKTCRRRLGDVVRNFIKGVTHRQLGSDLGNRESGGL